MAAPHPRPLGILCPELPRLRTARLPRCPLQAILRQVLVIAEARTHPPAQRSSCDSLTVSLDCLISPRLAGTRKSLIGLGTDALVRCRVKTSHHGLARRR